MAEVVERLKAALADRYRIERELGAGGMATVYLAEDLRHHRKVAIKVLRPELAASLGPERFLREVTIAANLTHPHILPLHDSGDAAGFLLYVMPYVEGVSLRQKLLREGALPIPEAVRILRDIADAMAYAHSHGVVHRDIKPENVMLVERHALVMDFGVAKAVAGGQAPGGTGLTSAGVAVGTPAYMAPEQAAGETHVDHRADLYAWGTVGYELLAGQPPFLRTTPQSTLAAHLTATPEPLTAHRASVPWALAQLVMQCLEKKAADRPQSAEEVLRRLDQVLTPGGGMTPAETQPVRSKSRPSPWKWALVVIAALAVVGLGWWTFLRPRAGPRHIERLAVLPIENATRDRAHDILAEGLTRELISALTTAGVRVIGYRSVAKYRAADVATADVARELNVGALVTGAVLRGGSEVQLAVELVDPASSENLWSETFAAPANAMPDLRNRVARGIAEAAGISGGQAGQLLLPQPRSVHPDVYKGYLLGLRDFQRYTPEGFTRAIGYLEQALALDSAFAPAWAALGLIYGSAGYYPFVPPAEAFPKAKAAIERALAIDEQLGLAYMARGFYRLWHDADYAAAEQDLRYAVQLSPSSEAYEHYGGFMSMIMGRHEEGVRALEHAVAMEPKSALMHEDLGWRLLEAGEKERARQVLGTAIALDSSRVEPWLAMALLEASSGRVQEAFRALERFETLSGGPVPVWRAVIFGISGRKGEAKSVADSLLRTRPEDRAPPLLLFLAGRSDAALSRLEELAKTRVVWQYHAPWFQYLLGDDPRYQRLLATIGVGR